MNRTSLRKTPPAKKQNIFYGVYYMTQMIFRQTELGYSDLVGTPGRWTTGGLYLTPFAPLDIVYEKVAEKKKKTLRTGMLF